MMTSTKTRYASVDAEFIKVELALAMTLLQTGDITAIRERKQRCRLQAQKAYETARRLLITLPRVIAANFSAMDYREIQQNLLILASRLEPADASPEKTS
jgi:hypothetical protein